MTEDAQTRDRSEHIRRLVAECVERYAQEGDAAVDAVCAAHPEDAEAIRERISRLGRAGLLDAPDKPRDQIPERLGEFRLIRRLGIGGMGVVYLAEQESLGREVALKLVRPELLYFPGARERFRREVEAIARLADPGIVPIHAVGEDSGIPYFAMAYVEGATLAGALLVLAGRDPAELSGGDLAEALARAGGTDPILPRPEVFRGSWAATCAQIVRAMALALHHAHERGVVHRDVKPSNAICTPNGDVLLLDFGLASAEGSTRVTRSGAQVGTPYCMAPEQILGGTIDARTDVYALGVTLYELLTLRAPFDAPSDDKLRSEILGGVMRAPSKLNRDVPRDLDVVCAKAMDRDAVRRYPTALDLELFLAHRPITARPAGTWLRTRRWARRHPGVAAATLFVPLLLLGAYGWFDARRTNERLETELEATLNRSLAAIDQLLAQARDAKSSNTPGLDKVRLAQLDSALTMLRSLRNGHPERERFAISLAQGLASASILHNTIGQYDEALRTGEEGSKALEPVRDDGPFRRERDALGASLLLARGTVLLAKGKLDEAEDCWHRSAATFESLQKGGYVPAFVLRDHASCLTNLAMMARTRKDFAAAETWIRESIALDERAGKLDPRPEDDHTTIVMRTDLAVVLRQLGRHAEANEMTAAIAKDIDALVAAHPDDPDLLREQARSRMNLSRVALVAGDSQTAYARAAQAAQGFQRIADQFPERVTYTWELDMTLLSAAQDAVRTHRPKEARVHYEAAIRGHEALIRRLPDRREYINELTAMRRGLAGLLDDEGDPTAAREILELACRTQSELVAGKPEDPIWSRQLAMTLAQRGILHAHEDPALARSSFEAATERFDALRRSPHGEPTDTTYLIDCLERLADACSLGHDNAAAIAALRRVQALQPMSADELERLGAELRLADEPEFQNMVEAARKN